MRAAARHDERLHRYAVAAALGAAVCLAILTSGCAALTSQGAASRPSTPLTEKAVRAVLDSMGPSAVRDTYLVDSSRFAASVAEQLPMYADSSDPNAWPTTFRAPGDDTLRPMSQVKAQQTVDEALAVYRGLVASVGPTGADEAMASGAGAAYDALSPSDQGRLGVLQEGATRLTFMFGEPDASQWSWRVTKVSIVGTDTADVTYAVDAPSGQSIAFTTSTFTKRLRFAPAGDGGWVLVGWLDYPAFERAVKRSITPSDEIPNMVPNWWDTLGAQ